MEPFEVPHGPDPLNPAAAAAAAAAGELADDALLQDGDLGLEPLFEYYRQQLPDEILSGLDDLIKELEGELQLDTKGFFKSQNIQMPTRQRIWAFLQGLDLETLPQNLVLHRLPWDPTWQYSLAHSGFLCRPPVPSGSGAQGRKRSKGAAAAEGAGKGGSLSRSFNSYQSNTAFPISNTPGEDMHLYFTTRPAPAPVTPAGAEQQQQQQQQVATYRLYVCISKAGQRPGNARGHEWQRVELKRLKDGRPHSGWLDTSIALGVWEPMTARQQQKRQKVEKPGPQSSDGSGAVPDPAERQPSVTDAGQLAAAAAAASTAAAAAAGTGPAIGSWFQQPSHPSAAAAAAAAAAVAPGSLDAVAAIAVDAQFAVPLQHQLQQLQQQLQLGSQFLGGFSMGGVANSTPLPAASSAFAFPLFQPFAGAPLQPQQQQQQQQQQLTYGQLPYAPPLGGLIPATATGVSGAPLPLPPPPAAGAAAALTPSASLAPHPPAAPAAATDAAAAAAVDDVASMLGRMVLDQQHKQYRRLLLSACNKPGGDLLQVFMQAGGSGSQQQQQQREEAQGQLVQLLLEQDVKDERGRNLLHLVATHNLGIPHTRRMQQLAVLLDADHRLAAKLMDGLNNNGSTPLIVAASRIRGLEDAEVFRRLLRAAGPLVLGTATKSGWTLLHCLANEAANASQDTTGVPQLRVQLLQTLMREVVQAVQTAAAHLAAPGTPAAMKMAAALKQLCLGRPEPACHYSGHAYLQQVLVQVQVQQQ